MQASPGLLAINNPSEEKADVGQSLKPQPGLPAAFVPAEPSRASAVELTPQHFGLYLLESLFVFGGQHACRRLTSLAGY